MDAEGAFAFRMISEEKESLGTDIDVSEDFDFILQNLFVICAVLNVSQLYQLLGIFVFHKMLYLRFWVSRANKCVLMYGLFIYGLLNYYRYREAGKICSGDYLSSEEWYDETASKNYLIYQGSLLKYYSRFIVLAVIVSALMISYVLKQMLSIFN